MNAAVIVRSSCDEAIQSEPGALDCFASLAMTWRDRASHPIDQNHPNVVDVGERRAGQQQIAGQTKERGGVVVIEIGLRIEAQRLYPGEGRGIDDGGGEGRRVKRRARPVSLRAKRSNPETVRETGLLRPKSSSQCRGDALLISCAAHKK